MGAALNRLADGGKSSMRMGVAAALAVAFAVSDGESWLGRKEFAANGFRPPFVVMWGKDWPGLFD